MNLFELSPSNPPSEQQLKEISEALLLRLCKRTQIAFEVTSTHFESGIWITTEIRSPPLFKETIDLVLDGMIGYSFRRGDPSIESVLLPFSRGRRLSSGDDTILTASFVKDLNGGEWSEFCWSRDVYSEWECDELPPLV